MFMKLLNPTLLIPVVAKTIGVPPAPLQLLIKSAQRDLEPVAGDDFALVPAISSVMDGDFSAFRMMYDKFIADPKMRPGLAYVAAKWLEQNDTEHIAMKAMGFISDLPLVHMGRDFDSVESFLLEGFFPLLDEAFSSSSNCPQCGGILQEVISELLQCNDCGHYKDKS